MLFNRHRDLMVDGTLLDKSDGDFQIISEEFSAASVETGGEFKQPSAEANEVRGSCDDEGKSTLKIGLSREQCT